MQTHKVQASLRASIISGHSALLHVRWHLGSLPPDWPDWPVLPVRPRREVGHPQSSDVPLSLLAPLTRCRRAPESERSTHSLSACLPASCVMRARPSDNVKMLLAPKPGASERRAASHSKVMTNPGARRLALAHTQARRTRSAIVSVSSTGAALRRGMWLVARGSWLGRSVMSCARRRLRLRIRCMKRVCGGRAGIVHCSATVTEPCRRRTPAMPATNCCLPAIGPGSCV